MHEKQRKALDSRMSQEKEKLLEELRKAPVVHAACKLAGVGKATYYRWRAEDMEFAARADAALTDGKDLMSDVALSQLFSLTKEKNVHAIRMVLTHYHPDFRPKVEISGTVRVERELTPEEQESMMEAVELGKLTKPEP